MKRRTFLQSFAAAMSTVAAGVKFPQRIQRGGIDYSFFCGEDVVRFDLSRPFGTDGILYASDCKILISHPSPDWSAASPAERLPNLSDLPWDDFDRGKWRPLGGPRFITDEVSEFCRCATCLGTGRIGIDVSRCRKCDGYGGGCGNCRFGWTGGTQCADCDPESGDIRAPFVERFGQHRFEGAMTNRVRLLGDAEYRVVPHNNSRLAGGVMMFRFGTKYGDGRGMLASIAK